jgi:type II secretory pathway component PulC
MEELSSADSSVELGDFPSLLSKRKTQENGNEYKNIVDRNLFSSDREPPSGRSRSVSSNDEDEEGTTSFEGFELVGTVLSDDDRSLALIRKGGAQGEVKAYHLRDSIDGMELQEIYYDKIILSKNGKEIVLLLEPRDKEKQSRFSPNIKSIERRKNKPGTQKSKQQSWTPKQRKDQ